VNTVLFVTELKTAGYYHLQSNKFCCSRRWL